MSAADVAEETKGTTSKHSSKNARIKWLKKGGHRLQGRADGGSVKFGTYTSTDVTETVKEASTYSCITSSCIRLSLRAACSSAS